jgi:Na+/melibiose symporter-like transporter
MLNYIEVVLKFGTIEYLIAALVLMVGVLIFVSFWRKSVEKKGKKKTLLTIFLIAMFFLPLSLIGIFPLTPPINVIFGLLFMLGIALIYAGWGLIPPIINADLAEDARKKEGELLAGLYKGFPSILLNIFQAFGTMILGLILALPPLFGVEYSFGYIIWGLICSGFLIITYFFTKKYLTLDFEWEKS